LTSEGALFAGLYTRGAVAAELTDAAWLQALLDVEAALARAAAAEGEISGEAAAAIEAACVASRFDVDALGRDGGRHASPVVSLVAALRQAVGEPYARDVHVGATSQDILDTALMLIALRALTPTLADARGAADAAAALADGHRRTVMIGRTLLQQAAPVTFGLQAAAWLSGLDAATERLEEIRRSGLFVEMGGPVGSRAPQVGARVAAELGLSEPVLPWATIRVAPAELAGALGVLAGVLGKLARDVTLLAQQEVGEVSEGGEPDRGRSSAMPHKRNPVAAVSVLACVKRVPGLVATVLACMEQEHERAAGAWQAEWGTHVELLGLVGSATAWARELLEHLHVDVPRMRANLEASAASEAAVSDGTDELIDRALRARRSTADEQR
jgi:3-carboxy-cis,cis-muconate cycloisomerase